MPVTNLESQEGCSRIVVPRVHYNGLARSHHNFQCLCHKCQFRRIAPGSNTVLVTDFNGPNQLSPPGAPLPPDISIHSAPANGRDQTTRSPPKRSQCTPTTSKWSRMSVNERGKCSPGPNSTAYTNQARICRYRKHTLRIRTQFQYKNVRDPQGWKIIVSFASKTRQYSTNDAILYKMYGAHWLQNYRVFCRREPL